MAPIACSREFKSHQVKNWFDRDFSAVSRDFSAVHSHFFDYLDSFLPYPSYLPGICFRANTKTQDTMLAIRKHHAHVYYPDTFSRLKFSSLITTFSNESDATKVCYAKG